MLSEALRRSLHAPGDGDHVVLLVDQFPAVLGGGERVVLRTARLLRGAGYRVSIVTFQVLCAPEVLRAAECPVYLLPLSNVISGQALRAAWQLGAFLRRAKVRVAMTFFESSNLFGGLVVKSLSRARLIWNRRDMGILREPKHRMAYRWLPFLPDFVIAVSEEVRRHAIEVDRIAPDRVGVIYNGSKVRSRDNNAQNETRRQVDSAVIVTVGNLRRVKGQDTLLEAAAIVLQKHPEARFLVAGESLEAEFYDNLQRRVLELGVGEHFHFLGGVPEPQALLREASIFVLPSRSEGFSNAIVEAMAAGLPVVATTVGGNAEAVVDGVTGLLVPPEQPEALAAALLTLIGDPERSSAMGAAARARAAEVFSEEAMLQGLTHAFSRAERRSG
ncbi:MAG: glycosyltransferase [Terriglobus roseus]|nr:glycosyltransferase [Terriglobus roseus]